jgi:hypothetical protein
MIVMRETERGIRESGDRRVECTPPVCPRFFHPGFFHQCGNIGLVGILFDGDGVSGVIFGSSAAGGWLAASFCIIVISSGGACGGIPFARTMAQCHSWSGKRAKFKAVRKVAVVEGAADPFTCSSIVTSGCFWSESCTCVKPPATAGIIRNWPNEAVSGSLRFTMVRPITTSRSSQAVPLCMDTCNESPSMVAGPSSLASSAGGKSSNNKGSERELVFVLAVNDKLQVTSGEETWKPLATGSFPRGSSENTGEAPDARRVSASSITLDRLSSSTLMSAWDGAGFLRRLRAMSPRGASVSSCAEAREGNASKAPARVPTTNRAKINRFGVVVRTGNGDARQIHRQKLPGGATGES